jgi:hypothetical protein
MTQALYAHMNNKIIKKMRKAIETCKLLSLLNVRKLEQIKIYHERKFIEVFSCTFLFIGKLKT